MDTQNLTGSDTGAAPNVAAMAEEISGALFVEDPDDANDDAMLSNGDDTLLGDAPDKELDPKAKADPDPKASEDVGKKSDPLKAPSTWRPEVQAKFATLDPEVQAEILKREEDMFKGIEGYKQTSEFGKAMQQVFAPHLEALQKQGIQPIEHMNALLEVHNIMSGGTPGEKYRLINLLAQQYGVDLGKPAPQEDPEVARLRRENENLKMKSEAQIRMDTEAKRAQVLKEIEAFAADPANIYYAEVEADIPALLRGGVAKTLKDAYDKAVWANPVTRAKEQARQQAESSAKAKAEAEAERKKRERLSAPNLKSKTHPGGSGTVATGSIDDTLNETLRSLKSRA